MPVTREQLADYYRFVDEKLSNGGAVSMQDMLDQWLDRQTHEASVADIRESIAQYEAGEALPVDQAFSEVRRKLGWTE